MSNERYGIVKNTSTHPIIIDEEEGKQVLPGEFAVVQRSKVKGFVDNEELRYVDPEVVGSESAEGVRIAKEGYGHRKKEWEEEKAKDDNKPQVGHADTNYDDSASSKSKHEPKSTTSSASAKRNKEEG